MPVHAQSPSVVCTTTLSQVWTPGSAFSNNQTHQNLLVIVKNENLIWEIELLLPCFWAINIVLSLSELMNPQIKTMSIGSIWRIYNIQSQLNHPPRIKEIDNLDPTLWLTLMIWWLRFSWSSEFLDSGRLIQNILFKALFYFVGNNTETTHKIQDGRLLLDSGK